MSQNFYPECPINIYHSDDKYLHLTSFSEHSSKYWKENELFLRSINTSVSEWNEKGIEWLIGVEFEFRLDAVENVTSKLQSLFTTNYFPLRKKLRNESRVARLELQKRLKEFYTNELNQVTLSDDRERYLQKRLRESEDRSTSLGVSIVHELRDIKMPGAFFELTSSSTNNKKIPLIQIGTEADSKSQADDDYESSRLGIFELRFNPVGPLQSISQFNETVTYLHEAEERYGIIFTPRLGIHLHISAHDNKTSETITSIETRKHVEKYRRIMEGVGEAILSDGFILVRHGKEIETPSLGIGPTRMLAIRILNNRFEIRCGDTNPAQISKHLALTLGGALYAEKFPSEKLFPVEIRSRAVAEGVIGQLGHILNVAMIQERVGSFSLELPTKKITSYDWFVFREFIQELTGNSCFDLLPGSPIFNPERYQPILDVLETLPLIPLEKEGWKVNISLLLSSLSVIAPTNFYKKLLKRIPVVFERVSIRTTIPTLYSPYILPLVSKTDAISIFQKSPLMKELFGSAGVEILTDV